MGAHRIRFAFFGLIVLGLVLGLGAHVPVRAEDPTIVEARKWRHGGLYRAEEILEKAVADSPHRVDYWIELIHVLDASGYYPQRFLARWACRAALRANPNSPELLLAQAHVLPANPALDVLAELGRIPGHEEESHDAREVILLGMRAPLVWPRSQDEPQLHDDWAWRLLAAGRWKRAGEIVDRGLALNPQDKPLLTCRALVLAERGDFEAALAAHRASQLDQFIPCNLYQKQCLGDILLIKGKPELAVRSFGEVNREAWGDGWDNYTAMPRLVYLQALLLTGEFDQAQKILDKSRNFWATVLMIANAVERNKLDDARRLAKKMLKSFIITRVGTYGGLEPQYYRDGMPKSLQAPIVAAAKWLLKEYPDKKERIEGYIGDPKSLFKIEYPAGPPPTLPSSQWIPKLEQQVRTAADADTRWELQQQLARALQDAERYDDACVAHIANMFEPVPSKYGTGFPIKPAALEWCICKRQAETSRYLAGSPERRAAIRQTLRDIQNAHWQSTPESSPGDKDLPTLDASVTRLTAMGPGTLALVFSALEPEVIHSRQQIKQLAALWRVIESVGSEQDIPVLITALSSWVRAFTPSPGVKQANDEEAKALASIAETTIHHALETLTKTKNPGTSPRERLDFWSSWWVVNARRIVLHEGK